VVIGQTNNQSMLRLPRTLTTLKVTRCYNSEIKFPPAPKVLPSTSSVAAGSIYEHYNGSRYKIVGVALHSETHEQMTVYQALYGEGGMWVRPFTMFTESVTIDGVKQPRFKLVMAAPREAVTTNVDPRLTEISQWAKAMKWLESEKTVENFASRLFHIWGMAFIFMVFLAALFVISIPLLTIIFGC
jgi:hypothetical protein